MKIFSIPLVKKQLPDESPVLLRQGEQQVLVLVNEDMLKAGVEDWLGQVMKSVKLSSPTIFQFHSGAQLPIAKLGSEHSYRVLLSFGIAPSAVGWHIAPPLYRSFTFAGYRCLFVESLTTIQSNKSKKLLLWDALKTMFELKNDS